MANYEAKDIMALRAKTSAGIALCKEALEDADGNMDEAIKYVNARSDVVSRLHNMTGAKIGLAKLAFADAEQDFEKAIELIKERGWEKDGVEAGCAVDGHGMIGTYVHGTDRRTVALVEVWCLTDFVAKNEKFITFANELAQQAAAMKPEYVNMEAVPAEKVEEMKDLFLREVKEEGKPDNIAEKIVEGKLNKFYAEKCLMQQKWFKDDSKTISNFVDETIGQLGEAITLKKVLVWEFGK
jgi:elongation factor Ts